MVHQLSVTVQLSVEQNGLEGMAAIIDTEGTFSPSRIAAIAKRFNIDPTKIEDWLSKNCIKKGNSQVRDYSN